MFAGIFLGLLVDAFLLGFIVTLVARHNATTDLFNMIVVVGGTMLGGVLLMALLGEQLGVWVVVPHVLLLGVLLIKFTGTNPVQTIIALAAFFGVKIAWRLALAAILSAA